MSAMSNFRKKSSISPSAAASLSCSQSSIGAGSWSELSAHQLRQQRIAKRGEDARLFIVYRNSLIEGPNEVSKSFKQLLRWNKQLCFGKGLCARIWLRRTANTAGHEIEIGRCPHERTDKAGHFCLGKLEAHKVRREDRIWYDWKIDVFSGRCSGSCHQH